MSKKYRQRGYQDESLGENHENRGPQRVDTREHGPRRGYGSREPPKVNMPGFHEVLKCAQCGQDIATSITLDAQCPQCSSDLHSCAQCTWFDTGSPLDCTQSIPHRVTPKDGRNTCSFYAARVTIERETRSNPRANPEGGSRQAFDDLFK